MKKKGWLFVLPWSPEAIGGVSVVVVELCKAMNKHKEYKPFILVEDWSAKKPIIIEKEDYSEIRYRLRSCSFQMDRELISFILHLPHTLFTLLKIINRYNIKVLNPHYPSLSSINLAFFKIFMNKLHFFMSFHGSDLSDIIMKKKEFKTWGFILNSVERVISCSQGMSERVVNTFPKTLKKSEYIHNGISPRFFQKYKNPLTINNYKLPSDFILSVGTFEHQKGQDMLIRAFSLIAEEFAELRLVLVGRSSTELLRYKQLVKGFLIEDKVFFYENIQPEDMGSFYRKAKLYVSASRNEAFGMVMLEAAAFNVPVVATKTIGACEIIENDVDGKLVDIDNITELTQVIIELLNDHVQSELIAINLFKKAKYQFTWDNALLKYLP